MTRKVKIGNVTIGGGSPIAVQSMLNVPAGDVAGSVAQARALEAAGCDIIRAAVPDREAVRLVPAIKAAVSVPLVADIHFDYRIALDCVAAGVDKIRLNPGNIGGEDRVKQVADACRAAGVPIRIGVNSGSLEKHILAKYGAPTPQALVDSALYHARLLEKFDFTDIVVSIKSSHVPTMIEAYRLAAEQLGCPLHLGVTEAGTARMGLIKSAVGIGSLLCDGIGDTIRVSLTADPVEEVRAARDILKAVGRGRGPEIVSCPTCGRTKIDLISLAGRVEEALADCRKDIKVAVMGCVVNGPGEAREADIGIAGGNGEALLFKKGAPVGKYPEDRIVDVLLEEIEKL
ncbi:flavodoxin-dependent (E)-4-hydroxy-3-methylbut-2-enyl-diphosphate synthase [Anaerotruncus massiliensis (ex Liu et al. 2021)]|uniref:4-hydroxy-3-methylbut-2-en-1-yl diphosphate synthase (flavodoxin) n=2 Tax=Anaerotruncus TaxID=244127 RepID=A0A498D1W5_9FIRM|nr:MULTISPECIES: flavodoxin-dependent (E)-4-hydroxy-3-methylbut-2-enyl-diphosphate synthase [Anaerotruncus]MBC3937412.1 flavodoxin-dependent (E)-4-hydroxy-3-methylbut-2-enyl-diphosphate synthase [Anaerotruncus massiliensis (ex Togo et al. 2019)]RLL14534.1 flavodoxin-dependent (E)-4-hydroxy-3-methylbut-2-enyl-diphosphate synthase [Anaerotruncus massiliensis (ex Liu et al. 2021)]